MSNWRHIAAIAVAGVICACLFMFIKGLKGEPDPSATLSGSVERLIGDWTVKNIPLSQRVVTLVIGDSGAGDHVLMTPREGPAKESFFDKLKRKLGLRASLRTVKEPTPFAKAFSRDPGAVTWTFDGFSKADEKAVVEELAKSIVKVHDAEAVLNIVAQGEIGGAVLKSLGSLEGQSRGGVQVGANSVVLLGMSKRRLRAYDPVYFSKVRRPRNVIEWANIYSEYGESLDRGSVEMFSAKYDGKALPGKLLAGLLPRVSRMSSSGLPQKLDALAMGIIGVFSRTGGLETWVSRQERLEEQRYEQQRQQAEMELARRRAEEEARRRAEAEARRRAEEARRRAEEEARRRARIQWVTIPGGTFMMGSNSGHSDEKPVHRVRVRSFRMAKTEVTVGQYRACVSAGKCTKPGMGGNCNWGKSGREDHPVNCVDWNQAKAFSRWAGGRLPSEAEWEYAARSGGRDREYPWGNEKATCRRAVMDGGGSGCGRGSTWPVCSKPAGNTEQGLCDMAGNVDEWVQDWHHGSYNGAPTNGSAWERPTGSDRVFRVGSWNGTARDLRAANRNGGPPGYRGNVLGFRLVTGH